MNIYLIYIVTALGVFLSLFWMLFIFLGRSIPGTQTIIWGKIEIKTNTVMGVLSASLVTAVMPLCMQFYIYLNRPDPPSGEVACESLKGHYNLHFNYVFGEKDGIRLIARDGNWKANSCDSTKENLVFALKGSDTTKFDIEFFHKGRYELVASGTFEYPSTLLIGENGKLISRTFEVAGDATHIDKYYDNWKRIGEDVTNEEVEGAIEQALKIRANIHIKLLTKYCAPTVGELGGRNALVFICQDYTRVMVKTS